MKKTTLIFLASAYAFNTNAQSDKNEKTLWNAGNGDLLDKALREKDTDFLNKLDKAYYSGNWHGLF